MTVDLQQELIADLTTELGKEETFDSELLRTKVINAIREIKTARRYPLHYSAEQINNDLYGYYSNIRNLALYDYSKMGAESQDSHSENSVGRTYTKREKIFNGILPLPRF